MNSSDKKVVLHCLKSMIDEEVCEECPLYGITGTDHCEKDCIRLAINALEQEPKKAHWITTRTLMHDGEFYCDRCKCDTPQNKKWDYCPNCGAKMEQGGES